MQRLTAIVAVARQNIKGQVNSRGKNAQTEANCVKESSQSNSLSC
jgi:hypothetical protein